MTPRVVAMSDRNQRLELIVSSDVQVARLQHDDGRRCRISCQLLLKRRSRKPSLRVGRQRNDVPLAQPEEPDRANAGAMPLRARQYADARCTMQALLLDVP